MHRIIESHQVKIILIIRNFMILNYMYIHNWVQVFHNLTANMQIDTIPHRFKVWLHWLPYIARRKKLGD